MALCFTLIVGAFSATAFNEDDLKMLQETRDCPKGDLTDAKLNNACLAYAFHRGTIMSGEYNYKPELPQFVIMH